MTSLTVNGQSQVPPGFRFHPTEEELLHYYLKKKVAYEKIDLDVIRDVDLNKLEPWDIQEKCKIGSTPQNDWYFFSHKDKKYPTGTRTNRATAAGFWKATGRDKVIYSSFKRIGMRKTLVFYKGRAPHGQKSDWIMHEYRLDENTVDTTTTTNAASSMGEMNQEDGWVVCRVFKKKNHHKSFDNSSINNSSKNQMINSNNDGALDHILQYMGRNCKKESDHSTGNININLGTSNNNNNIRFLRPFDMSDDGGVMQLPALESPTLPSLPNDCSSARYDHQACSSQANCYQPIDHHNQVNIASDSEGLDHHQTGLIMSDWATLDRLVDTHLNGQSDTSKQVLASCLLDPFATSHDQHYLQLPQVRSAANRVLYNNNGSTMASTQDHYNSEIDLWNFTRSSSSSSDPLCHMSNSSV